MVWCFGVIANIPRSTAPQLTYGLCQRAMTQLDGVAVEPDFGVAEPFRTYASGQMVRVKD